MQAIKPTDFGLAVHRIQQFTATVPGGSTNEDLSKSDLWVNIGPQCRMNDMIWVDADDLSFTALLKVTFVAGNRITVRIIFRAALDVVDPDNEEAENAPYFLKMLGAKKWCIIDRATAKPVIEGIPTKLDGMKQLEDYLRALAA